MRNMLKNPSKSDDSVLVESSSLIPHDKPIYYHDDAIHSECVEDQDIHIQSVPTIDSEQTSMSSYHNHRKRPESSQYRLRYIHQRMPCIGTIVLFICALVGYASIVTYYLNPNQATDATDYKIIRSVSKHQRNKEQTYADNELDQNLQKPSLISEMYHNPTKKDKKLLKSTRKVSKDSTTPPQPPPPNECHGTIMILRHCEKANVDNHCSFFGYERSLYISTLFDDGTDTRHRRYPKPSFLYALAPNQRANKHVRNFREIETLMPTSLSINVTIATYGMHDKQHLTNLIYSHLLTGALCDKVAIISWKHDDIPHLAHSLGCGPLNGCPSFYASNDFDTMWQIHFIYQTKDSVPHAFEEAIAKDSKEGGMWTDGKSDGDNNKETNKELEEYGQWNENKDRDKRSLNKDKEHPEWQVYGSLQKEGFDPLAFNYRGSGY